MLDSGKIHSLNAEGRPGPPSKKKRKKNLTIEEFQSMKEEEGGELAVTAHVIRRSDPVNKLARTLRKYKESRLKSEDELLKIMEKVKLDKGILLKEKIESIWGRGNEVADFKQVKHEIDLCKHRRHEHNTRQREAYVNLLMFLKERKPGGALSIK
jgi:hypothetical protein